ncbi:uncharacterized protein At3g60930, chloroplastic-like [Eutrema salsugineum]|uniref:uncharacterized protein At3g60930, chloroplastic-like n=1 Tax=Eutrema salsugineum TaxID=72664 RepID=UPI000CED1464|nr:uncharacterized protein At3g60930, chloroplastic-like [Eutrema salsugineum]
MTRSITPDCRRNHRVKLLRLKPSRFDDSLDSLFHYEPSHIDAEARGTTESSEASVSPSPSNRSSDEASNHANPSDDGSPDDEPSVSTSHPQDPVPDEDINRAAVKAEEEAFPFDLFEAKRELERLMASRGASTSGRGPRVKRKKPDPPGSTFSSLESLEASLWDIQGGGVCRSKEERPSRQASRESLHSIMPRSLRHMIGILVRSFECGVDIELNHLLNLLEIRKAPKGNRFYISNKSNRRIIGAFQAKTIRSILPPIPDNLFVVRDSLSARKVNWRKNFTLERVEKAQAILAGVPVSSSPSSSSRDTREKMVIITLRDKKRREEEEAARRAAEAAQAQIKAIPKPDPPSREGVETVQAAEANTAEAAEKDAAPEVELGEIIPEASRDDSAARSKTPSNSAILAADKGKGVAVRKDEPSKKRRKPTPGDPAARKLVVDDPDYSAVVFVRVNNANTRLPLPEKLRRPRSYGAMAHLMAEYEADLSKVERRLDEARNETAATKGKLDEAMSRVSRLEEEKIVLCADVDKVSASVIRLEEARRAKSAEVVLLKRRIEAKDALFEAKVKRAKKEARRELTAKFQERLAKVEEGLAKLEKAKTDENELGQIKGNLAMIADLKKPDAPTLDDEEA